jgi:hypothetical protein
MIEALVEVDLVIGQSQRQRSSRARRSQRRETERREPPCTPRVPGVGQDEATGFMQASEARAAVGQRIGH